MIRAMQLADLEAIRAFWNPMIRDTLVTFSSEEKSEPAMRDWLASRDAAGFGSFTALIADQPVGFASYCQFRGGNGYTGCMEHTIILSEAARGQGLGRHLMQAVEDHARAAGHRLMVAAVSGGNPEGRAFHQAIGYRPSGTLPGAGRKFGRDWDLWLMHKPLQ
ncbi:GNAT family N-acetyltransferase [Gemmobacter serpentinus]|uniref:GNAT family N-acetyltransferase n=1 Tax=Gemmobacter serpentinus TaxID=2652247 RepID=UPI00124E8EBC|nr:GNAT family N-acetyltransferase [Gemmobacter serpentinus]